MIIRVIRAIRVQSFLVVTRWYWIDLLQASHETCAVQTCIRFIACNLAVRALRHRSQCENLSISQRSANTRPPLSCRPYSMTSSSNSILGGEKRPRVCKFSSAPFPARVGIMTQHSTPASKAKSRERFAQTTPSDSSRNGGRRRIKARTSIRF